MVALLFSLIGADGISQERSGLFFKIDYGLVAPLGDFGQSLDLEDSYAVVGHGGSLSIGSHIDERWSIALAVHNTLNKIKGAPLFDFNSKENYQLLKINLETYYQFSSLYLKPMIGVASRNTPWYRLTLESNSFLDEYIFLGPENKLGLNYGLGLGALIDLTNSTQFLVELEGSFTSADFEVYQGNIITGFREDIRKSLFSLGIRIGLIISN